MKTNNLKKLSDSMYDVLINGYPNEIRVDYYQNTLRAIRFSIDYFAEIIRFKGSRQLEYLNEDAFESLNEEQLKEYRRISINLNRKVNNLRLKIYTLIESAYIEICIKKTVPSKKIAEFEQEIKIELKKMTDKYSKDVGYNSSLIRSTALITFDYLHVVSHAQHIDIERKHEMRHSFGAGFMFLKNLFEI